MADERALRSVDIPRSSELTSDRLIIEGGRSLEGTLHLQGAKNLALPAIAAAFLTPDGLTLTNFPHIADLEVNLNIAQKMGAEVKWLGTDSVFIKVGKLESLEIDPADALKTTGSRYFIPPIVRRFGRIVTGPYGGDVFGSDDRYQFHETTLNAFKRLGIGVREINASERRYEFFPFATESSELNLPVRSFNLTVQTLLAESVGDREFKIYNPCLEPEIFELMRLLTSMGADIYYDGEGQDEGKDCIRICGRNLSGSQFRIMSDPNALVSWAAMALVTDGDVTIEGIDHNSKVKAFLAILQAMGANYSYDEKSGTLRILPLLTSLTTVNLVTDFWPAQCHTDWQPLLTPVLARISGESFIDENVIPRRFTAAKELGKMGFKYEEIQDPSRISRGSFKNDDEVHSLKIIGPVDFHPPKYEITAPPDIRGATAILIAMLSIQGTSTFAGIGQVARGIQDIVSNLQALGADVSFG